MKIIPPNPGSSGEVPSPSEPANQDTASSQNVDQMSDTDTVDAWNPGEAQAFTFGGSPDPMFTATLAPEPGFVDSQNTIGGRLDPGEAMAFTLGSSPDPMVTLTSSLEPETGTVENTIGGRLNPGEGMAFTITSSLEPDLGTAQNTIGGTVDQSKTETAPNNIRGLSVPEEEP